VHAIERLIKYFTSEIEHRRANPGAIRSDAWG